MTLAPEEIVNHTAWVEAVHAQPAEALTATVTAPQDAPTFCDDALSP
jgi:hypothetical protein